MRRILLLFFIVFGINAVAQQTISVQGVLREPNGRSIADGTYSIVFSIYNTETGGSALWTDTYGSITIKHGIFDVNLGENTPLTGLAFDEQYYLGIQVESFPEMSPRMKLTTFPYAMAILGNNNKFPSSGNIVLEQDSIIIKQGGIKLDGPNGRIVFNDGSSLNTATLGGDAAGVQNPSAININADSDGVGGDGSINFQINGSNIGSFGATGQLNLQGNIETPGTLTTGAGTPQALQVFIDGIQSVTSGSGGTLKLNPNGGNVETPGEFHAGGTIVSKGATQQLQLWDNGVQAALNGGGGATLNLNPNGGNVQIKKLIVWDTDFTFGTIGANYVKVLDNGMQALNNGGPATLTFNQNGGDVFTPGNILMEGGMFQIRRASDGSGIQLFNDNRIQGIFNGGAGDLMLQGAGGNVGIGLAGNPSQARLEVSGAVTGSISLQAYLDADNADVSPTNQVSSWPFSILASDRIGASAFMVHSDARIKKVVGRSASADDLELLKQIQITDYVMKDRIGKDSKIHKKVIAQEVKEVLPSAIVYKKDYIPSIYAASKACQYDAETNALTISMATPHELEAGDKVKLITESGEKFVEVTSTTNAETFTVAHDEAVEKLFVYGKQVDDFHVVDYDAISMLNVSATQELAKQLETLKAENAALKQKLEKMESLEARLSSLEALLAPAKEEQIGQK